MFVARLVRDQGSISDVPAVCYVCGSVFTRASSFFCESHLSNLS